MTKAQLQIDNAISIFLNPPFRKAFIDTVNFNSVVFTSTTATLPNDNNQKNFYQYTVIRIDSGAKKGLMMYVDESENGVLTFESDTDPSGTFNATVFQIAKLPRLADVSYFDGEIQKTIPEFIKEAVELQYALIESVEGAVVPSNMPLNGYSVSQDSYSENRNTGERLSAEDRLSPEVLDILTANGLSGNALV